MAEDVPPQAARFLGEQVESVRQLEVLLLLRDQPGRAWTPHEVSEQLSSSPAWAAQMLEDLRDKHLVAVGGDAYRYAPADAALAATVDTVAGLYARRKTTVVSLIFGGPGDDPVRSLADAFRIRRER